MGLMFNIFIGDPDEEMECNVSKFADEINLGGVADTPETRQWDLESITVFERPSYSTLS